MICPYCRQETQKPVCWNCGKKIEEKIAIMKGKKFCDDDCRSAWHNLARKKGEEVLLSEKGRGKK